MRHPMPKAIVLVALGVAACIDTGSSLRARTTDGDVAASDGAPQDMAQDAAVAGNGVPIPPVDPKWNCDRLGIQLVTMCPAAGTCPNVDCNCPVMVPVVTATVAVFEGVPCYTGLPCVASVSCPAACDAGGSASNTAAECASDGLCTTDQDCGAGQTCVPVPGQTHGACSLHDVGSPCFMNSDCTSSLCVADAALGARRHCSDGMKRSPCNRDSQCVEGRCVFASADTFSGVCSGAQPNGSTCATDMECSSGHCRPPTDAGAASVCAD